MRPLESSRQELVSGLSVAVEEAHHGRTDQLTEIMQQNNQRLFRIARSIVRDDMEAEDVVQDAFVKAFTQLQTLRTADSMTAWLSKITVNLALSKLRQIKRRNVATAASRPMGDRTGASFAQAEIVDHITPEATAAISDIRNLLEHEIDSLGDGFREVFVMRAIEQMSVEETANALNIRPETVKSRLHRAKATLRAGLEEHLTAASLEAFPFGGSRCARTTGTVIARLQKGVRIPSSRQHH